MKSEIIVGETPPARPALPLFYRDPRILDPQRHARAGIREGGTLAFAARTNSVPLAADEMFIAQAHYPIVFTVSRPAAPVALLGVAPDKNLFLADDGSWRKGAYVPAYVRRYPFVFVRGGDNKFVLAIDEGAECYAAAGGNPLFDGKEPAAGAKQALQFCAAFQQQFERAQAFAGALDEQQLLVDYRADVRTPKGVALSLSGFRVVDEAKFNALPDEIILDWRRKGHMALIYAHLMSMHRWQALAAMVNESGDAR